LTFMLSVKIRDVVFELFIISKWDSLYLD
jgi:hypothetical protein